MCKRSEYSLSRKALQHIIERDIPTITRSIYLDNTYYCVSLEDWNPIFFKAIVGMPKYLAERFDCDDFAFAVAYRITEQTGLNGCRVALGNTHLGYHAYNLFITGSGELFYLEPQTLEITSVKDNELNYITDTVII